MRVAFLMGSLNRGGTETLILDVLRNAKHCEFNVMCLYRKPGQLEADFKASGVFVEQLKTNVNIALYLLQLRRKLLKEKIQVVHAQQAIDALYARMATVGTGIKVVLTIHGYDFTDGALSRKITSFILGRTDATFYVSRAQKEYYIQKYNAGRALQAVVYNGISFQKLDLVSENESDIRKELQISSEVLLLGTVGNFNAVRDQMTICRFLALLKTRNIAFHFVFAGKKDDKNPNLFDDCVAFCQKHGLSDQVHFLGSRQDVPSILQDLDVFVYSTHHDTFGIAVVEALAVGLPVLVNDWGVMTEITQGGKFARIYKTGQEDDLLSKFDKLDIGRKQVGAMEYVRIRFSIETHIQELQKMYNELLQ